MHDYTIINKYEKVVERVTQMLKKDKTVLAATVYGSAKQGDAWIFSDIDIYVVVSDEKVPWKEVSLIVDDILINIDMFSREEFKRCIEGRQSFGILTASIFASSKLLFADDPMIEEYHKEVQILGKSEVKNLLFKLASSCILNLEKANKNIYHTKAFPQAFKYIKETAELYASLILLSNGKRVLRHNIEEASKIEPDLFQSIYYDLINKELSESLLKKAIEHIFCYYREHQLDYLSPLLEYLEQEKRILSVTEIAEHFGGVHGIAIVCEWLVGEKVLNRASTPLRLTSKSKEYMPEAAYFI